VPDTNAAAAPEAPKVDPREAALDAAFAVDESAPTETPKEQPRDEQGRFAPDAAPATTPDATAATVPATDAPAATPSSETPPAPARKVVKIKVDDAEREIDLDAEYADENRRKRLAEVIQKGEAFDTVKERQRKQGQQDVLAVLRQHGYDVQLDPTTNQPRIVPPQQANQPAAAEPAKPQARDMAALKARLKEGDAEAASELIEEIEQREHHTRSQFEQFLAEQKAERERADQTQRWNTYVNEWANVAYSALNKAKEALGGGPEAEAFAKQLEEALPIMLRANVPAQDVAARIAAQAAVVAPWRKPAPSVQTPAVQPARSAAPKMPGVSGGGAMASGGVSRKAKTAQEALDEAFTPSG
jgi:hypothetical protein